MVVTDVAASAHEPRGSSSEASSYLLVPMLLFFGLLITAVLRSPSLISSAGIGSAVIVGTPLVLATYSVMASTLAGRATVDLSIGPLIGFINVTLVELFGMDVVTSPLAFFVYAIGVGVLYQILMALIVIFVRVQPIIVALSGYLALSGINLVIMVRPGGTAPDWMAPWGLGTSILSPVFAILVLATAAWLLFTLTAFYGHLRLMGSDERAAYTSGVRINIVRVGAHVIAGIFAGLAALTYTSLIASGDPDAGHHLHADRSDRIGAGGCQLGGRPRRRHRLAVRCCQHLSHYLCSRDLQLRQGAELCHRSFVRHCARYFAASDGCVAAPARRVAVCFAAFVLRRSFAAGDRRHYFRHLRQSAASPRRSRACDGRERNRSRGSGASRALHLREHGTRC